MNNLTDAEIEKALECCIGVGCSDCPYHHWFENCRTKRNNDCIDLINRLKEENERLQKENEQFADIGKMYSEIRAEAVKEFAERLKAISRPCGGTYMVFGEQIDNLVKEMTEKEN